MIRKTKSVFSFFLLLIMLFVLFGCEKNSQELYSSSVKSNNVNFSDEFENFNYNISKVQSIIAKLPDGKSKKVSSKYHKKESIMILKELFKINFKKRDDIFYSNDKILDNQDEYKIYVYFNNDLFHIDYDVISQYGRDSLSIVDGKIKHRQECFSTRLTHIVEVVNFIFNLEIEKAEIDPPKNLREFNDYNGHIKYRKNDIVSVEILENQVLSENKLVKMQKNVVREFSDKQDIDLIIEGLHNIDFINFPIGVHACRCLPKYYIRINFTDKSYDEITSNYTKTNVEINGQKIKLIHHYCNSELFNKFCLRAIEI